MEVINKLVDAFIQASNDAKGAFLLFLVFAIPVITSGFVASVRAVGKAVAEMIHGPSSVVNRISKDDDDEEDWGSSDGYTYAFPRPSVTTTIMLIHRPSMEFFAGIRDSAADAYPGAACLPGGFLEARVEGDDDRPGETVEACAVRETLEETGVEITERDLWLLDVRSDPLTDPRAHVINVCYAVFVTDEQKAAAYAADDLEDFQWRKLSDVDRERTYAFNHYEIILKGLRHTTAAAVMDGVKELQAQDQARAQEVPHA